MHPHLVSAGAEPGTAELQQQAYLCGVKGRSFAAIQRMLLPRIPACTHGILSAVPRQASKLYLLGSRPGSWGKLACPAPGWLPRPLALLGLHIMQSSSGVMWQCPCVDCADADEEKEVEEINPEAGRQWQGPPDVTLAILQAWASCMRARLHAHGAAGTCCPVAHHMCGVYCYQHVRQNSTSQPVSGAQDEQRLLC